MYTTEINYYNFYFSGFSYLQCTKIQKHWVTHRNSKIDNEKNQTLSEYSRPILIRWFERTVTSPFWRKMHASESIKIGIWRDEDMSIMPMKRNNFGKNFQSSSHLNGSTTCIYIRNTWCWVRYLIIYVCLYVCMSVCLPVRTLE